MLPESGVVYVDTQILIYTIERFPRFATSIRQIWDAADLGKIRVITSELALLETLVVPMRLNDPKLMADYEELILSNVRPIPVNREVLREAARLRAQHPTLRSPDAIHLATAKLENAVVFVTNDLDLRRRTDMDVVVLDDVST
jgi:predicted nucleic acid-binding protein